MIFNSLIPDLTQPQQCNDLLQLPGDLLQLTNGLLQLTNDLLQSVKYLLQTASVYPAVPGILTTIDRILTTIAERWSTIRNRCLAFAEILTTIDGELTTIAENTGHRPGVMVPIRLFREISFRITVTWAGVCGAGMRCFAFGIFFTSSGVIYSANPVDAAVFLNLLLMQRYSRRIIARNRALYG